jgi:hypothetical protein
MKITPYRRHNPDTQPASYDPPYRPTILRSPRLQNGRLTIRLCGEGETVFFDVQSFTVSN